MGARAASYRAACDSEPKDGAKGEDADEDDEEDGHGLRCRALQHAAPVVQVREQSRQKKDVHAREGGGRIIAAREQVEGLAEGDAAREASDATEQSEERGAHAEVAAIVPRREREQQQRDLDDELPYAECAGPPYCQRLVGVEAAAHGWAAAQGWSRCLPAESSLRCVTRVTSFSYQVLSDRLLHFNSN